jgi:hypothetical protein
MSAQWRRFGREAIPCYCEGRVTILVLILNTKRIVFGAFVLMV